jgi:hypothetical protein
MVNSSDRFVFRAAPETSASAHAYFLALLLAVNRRSASPDARRAHLVKHRHQYSGGLSLTGAYAVARRPLFNRIERLRNYFANISRLRSR